MKETLVCVKLIHPENIEDKTIVNVLQQTNYGGVLNNKDMALVLAEGIAMIVKNARHDKSITEAELLSIVFRRIESIFISTTAFEDVEYYKDWKEKQEK